MRSNRLEKHLRQTFLAGIFAAVPLAVTAFVIYWINLKTSVITEWLLPGRRIPFLGVVVAIAAIYLTGLIASSLLGRFFLRLIDKLLVRLPGFSQLYTAWKQIALTPGGTESVFSKVVIIPDETGALYLMGFCNGRLLEGDPNTYCVFVPAAPNPITGRLYFVRKEKCQFIDVATEEAFKIILSTGNYVPPGVGDATRRIGTSTRAFQQSPDDAMSSSSR